MIMEAPDCIDCSNRPFPQAAGKTSRVYTGTECAGQKARKLPVKQSRVSPAPSWSLVSLVFRSPRAQQEQPAPPSRSETGSGERSVSTPRSLEPTAARDCAARAAPAPRAHLHFVRRFWNQVLTCASVILRALARAARSAEARYFWRWKRFSSSQICRRVKDVRGFFFLGGVRF